MTDQLPVLTLAQAAERAGLVSGGAALRSAIRRGTLKAIRLDGRTLVVTPAALDAYLAQRPGGHGRAPSRRRNAADADAQLAGLPTTAP